MSAHPGFEDIGQRMLLAWSEGIQGLRDERVYAVGDWVAGDAFVGLTPSTKMGNAEDKNSAALQNNGVA
jgi:serine/threonine-protein kinase HipA